MPSAPARPWARLGGWPAWLAVALLLAGALASFARRAAPADWSPGWWRLTLVALAVAETVPVLWWRARPVAAWAALVLVCGVARLLEAATGSSAGALSTAGQFGLVLVLYGVGRRVAQRRALSLAAVTVVAAVTTGTGQPAAVVLIVLTAVLLGGSHAARDGLGRELALQEARTRIARELHDVVAHHMSVVAVQAETAPYRIEGLPPEATAQFRDLAAKARTALDEMRGLVGALRTGDEADRRPQPTLADLDGLLEPVLRTGTPLEADVDDRARDLDPVPALCAYRIVQESLSNALKHAPGRPVELWVTATDDEVRVRVRNQVATPAGPPGHGIAGMRERAELLGGALHAGPDDSGGFVVDATIPRRGAAR